MRFITVQRTKKSKRKIFSNEDAMVGHSRCSPEMSSNTDKAFQAKNPCVTWRGANVCIHFAGRLVREPQN